MNKSLVLKNKFYFYLSFMFIFSDWIVLTSVKSSLNSLIIVLCKIFPLIKLDLTIKVFSFEPIKGSKKIILLNLKKIENYFGIKIKNFKIINSAISNFNGTRIFYETNYKVASSLLKPKKKLSKKWIKSKDILLKEVSKGFKIKKKYKVKVLTLEKFCKQNKINPKSI